MSHGGKGFYVAFAGFVDSNVILFVAMFIVGGALFETGMANKIGGVVTHFAKSEKQLIIAIMIITFLRTSFCRSTRAERMESTMRQRISAMYRSGSRIFPSSYWY